MPADRLHVAILCYASVGGSGVVATELAQALALRGHLVQIISRERPFRWRSHIPGLSFVKVEMPTYPLFREPQYLLGLTNSIVKLAHSRPIDVIHAHYAVPHATAAYLAAQMLARAPTGRPRTVTTLHGTDITLIGSDPGYESVVAFSIEHSDAVTAVSTALRQDTIRTLQITRNIQVIPNFLDCTQWRRHPDPALRARIRGSEQVDAILVHVSNFRPVKRVHAVFEIFQQVSKEIRAKLVLIGDGPDRQALEGRVADEGLTGAVSFVGEQHNLVPWLSEADVFLLPSAQESFGLAALEAMACEVPVVASHVGGLPEVIEDGVTGYLCPVDAIDLMAERTLDLLRDGEKRMQMGHAAAERVRTRFCAGAVIPQYEACYREVLAAHDP
jgi:L-malate glycosyltransferase